MTDDAGSDRRRIVRAFLLAPLTAPAVYAVALIAIGIVRSVAGPGGSFSLNAMAEVVALVAAIGIPIAYVSALVAGAPMYLLLRRLGAVSHILILVVGATIGVAAALIIQPQVRGELISIPFPLWVGGLLGLSSAEVFWRISGRPIG